MKAVGPYSIFRIVGDFLYSSMILPINIYGIIEQEDIEFQTNKILENIDEILSESKFKKEEIVKTVIYVKDINNFSKINELYTAYFDITKFPVRTLIEVNNIPKNAQIGIEFVAYKKS